ncbi:MAG: DUF951 domain-containing protein [Lachnospiraceae bacterium]|nr:DUF951 domain-containing protein [Lachnospiraceae bacterium]
MNLNVGDIITTRKNHPCGGNKWELLRVGMDIRIKCLTCGRQIMLPRTQIEKRIRSVETKDTQNIL